MAWCADDERGSRDAMVSQGFAVKTIDYRTGRKRLADCASLTRLNALRSAYEVLGGVELSPLAGDFGIERDTFGSLAIALAACGLGAELIA